MAWRFFMKKNTNLVFIKLLWLVILCLNIGDYFLTLHALENGFIEGNPVMGATINTIWFEIIKLALVPMGIVFLILLLNKLSSAGRRRVALFSVVVFFVYCMPYLNVFWFQI